MDAFGTSMVGGGECAFVRPAGSRSGYQFVFDRRWVIVSGRVGSFHGPWRGLAGREGVVDVQGSYVMMLATVAARGAQETDSSLEGPQSATAGLWMRSYFQPGLSQSSTFHSRLVVED